MIRKNSRYPVSRAANFLERNYIWQENKLEKIVKEKEEEVSKGLEECTFKPKLNKYTKPISNNYHHLQTSKSARKVATSRSVVKSNWSREKDKGRTTREEKGR